MRRPEIRPVLDHLAGEEHVPAAVIEELQAVEIANRRFHPTPLASMLLDGCLENGTCSTAGGARYNTSYIQGVGLGTLTDAMTGVKHHVYQESTLDAVELMQALEDVLAERGGAGADGSAGSPRLIVTADANAAHQAVVRAMDAAGRVGLTRVSITTQQPEEE